MSHEIPTLWCACDTNPADRKEIMRCLIERVVASVRGDTEFVDVTIHWSGGFVSQHVVIRPVLRYRQLEGYDRMVARIKKGHAAGLTARQIADQLNREGFHAPSAQSKRFTANNVTNVLRQIGIRRSLLSREKLKSDEWWLEDLATELCIHHRRLHHWIRKGYVHSRKEPSSKFWILWADADELKRLAQMRDHLTTENRMSYPAELKRPKPRTADEAASIPDPGIDDESTGAQLPAVRGPR